jgi:hypothetical protein
MTRPRSWGAAVRLRTQISDGCCGHQRGRTVRARYGATLTLQRARNRGIIRAQTSISGARAPLWMCAHRAGLDRPASAQCGQAVPDAASAPRGAPQLRGRFDRAASPEVGITEAASPGAAYRRRTVRTGWRTADARMQRSACSERLMLERLQEI